MNCAGSNEWWQRGLDGEPIPRDVAVELEQHLAECPSCRQLHGLANLFAGPRLAFDRPMPPADLAGRLVRVVQTDRRRRRQRQLMGLVAVAASFVIAAVVYHGLPFTESGSPTPTIARHDAPSTIHATTATTPGLDRSVQEAGSALVSLTRRTADKTLADGRLLLPDVRPPAPVASPALLERTLETPAASLRQASIGLSNGLEPVADSARRAVQLFWQDMSPIASNSGSGL